MWNRKIKVALTSVFLSAAVLTLLEGYSGGLAAPVYAAGGCGLRVLHGTYAVSFQFLNQDPAHVGTPIGVGTHTPGAGVGVLTFDGKGSVSGYSTFAVSGLILRQVLETGTYTVNADCTGSLNLDYAGLHSSGDIAIADNGNEVFTIGTNSGDVAISRLRKQ